MTVWPACDVPPPRGVTARLPSRAIADRPFGFLDRARRHHAERHDLVVRRVGGIAPTREGVEAHVADALRLEPAFEASFEPWAQPCRQFVTPSEKKLDPNVAFAIQRHKPRAPSDMRRRAINWSEGVPKMPQKNASRAAGRHFLQIPGPTPVPDRVLRAMDTPLIDHRGPEFAKLAKRCLEGIKTIFKTTNPVIIYTATGTGAWEAALVNTLSPGDRVLMVETGQFATQWKTMAEKLGLKPEFIPGDWRTGADAAVIEEHLRKDKAHAIKAVCVLHNETATGLPLAHRADPQGDQRRRPPRAAHGRYHLLARLDRLPPRRMGRRRHGRRRTEGADAAARHVVQRGERQGVQRARRRRSCQSRSGRGTTCSP